MTTLSPSPGLTLFPRPGSRMRSAPLRIAAELHVREPRLAIYGALLLVLLLPMSIAWGFDDRMLRGADVWIKPMKFALSIALLALTTAWFAGHLPARVRAGRALDRIVWLLVIAGSFELGYITLQAGLGEASHYNLASTFHSVMYALMGMGALGLTATQPMLAWQLYRHGDPTLPPAYRQAVLLGLVLTFVLGAGVGMLLSSQQPSAGGASLPLFGWSLQGGDLRPAHFLGIHAEQVLPAIGYLAVLVAPFRARVTVWATTAVYVVAFGGLLGLGMR